MLNFLQICGLGMLNILSVYASDTCDRVGHGSESCAGYFEEQLTRLNPGKVGESQSLVINGIIYDLKTISIKPRLFEIDNFISPEECEHLIGLARAEGLEESVTRKHEARKGIFIRDLNNDQKLSVNEMMLTIEDNFDLYLNENDILKLYVELSLDKNGDQFIAPDELQQIDTTIIDTYLKEFSQSQPAKRSRHSKQTWIYPDSSTDQIFKNIQNRVQELTQLEPILIEKSDFQIVNYGVDGHYNAHHDSSRLDKETPCCTRRKTHACRICRFATILMYLNDVEEGGETAFPVADNTTIDSQKFIETHGMNLMRYCPDANVKVAPAKGKVVLWYNHEVDPTTSWLGDMDEYAWHGGCPVTKGNKWIANFWIKVTDDKTESLSPYL